MARQNQRQEADEPQDSGGEKFTGLDRLREELSSFASAHLDDLVRKAGDKVTGVAQHLTDSTQEGGSILPQVGKRLLQGDNPVKAMVGEKARNVKDTVVGKAKEAVGAGSGDGKAGSSKATNIVEVIDVGVPLRRAYNQWSQLEDFQDFTKGVRSVSVNEEGESDWTLKIGPSSRSWKAHVEEQIPDERIVWNSEGAKGTTHGVITFHELAPSLTRIVVVVEYQPAGFFEKTGNLWRAQGRRLRLDLKHFQRHVTFTDEEPEGWRGEIRDGEVVRSHDEVVEQEEAEAEDDQGGADGEGSYDDRDDDEAPDDPEEADEEGPEDEYEDEGPDEEDDDEDERNGDDRGEEDDEDEADEKPRRGRGRR
ncbi:SRPBCC family protein [Streptomyces tsukubensis]|uniref:Cyclase n=1 Tax=Streptomyces tsukubensis TaxID=83656 RepID=A0A1V4AFJ0_9ACTN|nr:SRPBCC family protein [Streptomyces tsukubensis]OON82662.1 cyclase [Streptomyces tsukubensis]QFR92168.1 cyclase [Streptomyces tsukubensis]